MTTKDRFFQNLTHARQQTDVRFAVFALILCLYLVWPCFTSVHVEGFSAQIESIAMLKSIAPNLEHDPYLPLITQFIYQTRSAVVDLLIIIYKVLPNTGDSAFRGLIFTSFILLLYSSVIFAKRWGNIPTLFAFFALLLTQGIPETAFFFNDNIVSAAFAVSALAIIADNPRFPTLLLSGLGLGIAILSRLDAVFIIPIFAGTLCLTFKSIYRGSIAFLIIGITTTIVLIIQYLLQGFSLLDAVVIGRKFATAMNSGSWALWWWIRLLFFGAISFPLFILGIGIFFRNLNPKNNYLSILTFVIYPLFLIIFAPKTTQIRYIFPLLSPLVALHVGAGLQWIYKHTVSDDGIQSKIAKGFIVAVIIISFLPPVAIQMMDGPRTITGRIWSPILWRHWQDSVNSSLVRTQGVMSNLDDHKTNMIISTHCNDEFFSRLTLIENGFIPEPAENRFPGCNGFSLFTKGDSTVIHVRTNPEYDVAPINTRNNAALQISTAFKCQSIQPINKVYLSAVANSIIRISPEIYGFTDAVFSDSLTVDFYDPITKITKNKKTEGMVSYKELSASEIKTMQTLATAYFLQHPQFDATTGKAIDITEYLQYYSPLDSLTDQLLHH